MIQVHIQNLSTMHLITYPDVVYNDAILIQTRCVQSVVILENNMNTKWNSWISYFIRNAAFDTLRVKIGRLFTLQATSEFPLRLEF